MKKEFKRQKYQRRVCFLLTLVMIFQMGASVFAIGAEPEANEAPIISDIENKDISVITTSEQDESDEIKDSPITSVEENFGAANEPEFSEVDEKMDNALVEIPIEDLSTKDEVDIKEKVEDIQNVNEKLTEENPLDKRQTLEAVQNEFKPEFELNRKNEFFPMGANVPSLFSLTWLEGGYNTDYLKEGIISGDGNVSLDITPNDNEKTRPAVYQLNFTMGGDRDAKPGEVKIRIPKHIFFGRNGEPVDTIKIPIEKAPSTGGATNFHYYEDGDDIVLTNYETFLRTESLTVAIQYDFWPYQVADGYSNVDIVANLDIKQDEGTPPIVTDSNKLDVTVHTNAKLREISKLTRERYEEWNDAWGEKPSDADEYFYNMWRISMGKPQYNTQPFEVKYVDIANPVGDIVAFSNTKVHWVISDPTSWTLNTKNPDGTDTFSEKVFYREENPKNGYQDTKVVTYIITRYKKDLAVENKRFDNKITANLTGVDGARDTKSGSSYFTYKKPAEYTGDGYFTSKSTDGSIVKNGLLNALENNMDITPLGQNNYTFSNKAEAFRMHGISEGGDKDYTVELVDNIMGLRQYEINGNPTNPWFELLTPGDDFNYQNIYVVYTEYDYKYNITTGYSRVESKDYSSYRPVELYIQKDGNSSWEKFGEFLRTGASTYNYQFKDINGNVTNYVDRSRPIKLPENTTNIKMVYTGNKYSVSIDERFSVKLNATDKVKEAVQKVKNSDEEVLNFYNINTMAIKNSEGEVINQRDKIDHSVVNNIIRNSSETGLRLLEQVNDLTGNSGKYLNHSASYIDLKWLSVHSGLSKTNKTPVSDVANGREIVPYTITMTESMSQSKNVISEELAKEWNLVAEQNSGVFYDLIPKGAWALRDTIKVYTVDYYHNGYGVTSKKGILCTHNVEFFPDWRGSGMTMMKVTVKAPMEHNIKSISTGSNNYFMFSGFILEFDVINTWDNILDTGKTMLNTVAYETGEGFLAKGTSDINPTTNVQEKQWYEDVNGNNDPDNRKFLYAQNKLELTPIIATEIGFTKKVKSVDEPVFGTLSEVPLGGEYVYRLRFAVNKNTQSKNVILYDVLENAYGSNEHWQGTFNRVDVSAARERNIEPVIYYSTRNDLNPRDNPSDGDITNTEIWSRTEPEDKKTIKAVAIDLSKNRAGNDYIFPAESVLPVYIYMDAPEGGVTSKVPPIYAYNDSYVRGTNMVGTGVNVDLNEKTDIVRVYLREIAMGIEKTANPESGTFDNPKDIKDNDNKLVYTLRITDKSTKDIARNVVVEDILPTGLVVDEEVGISFAFGNNGDSGKITEAKTIKLVKNGQKLTFTIDKIYGQNHLDLMIPVKVDTSQLSGVYEPIFQNQAIITSVGGRDYEVVSKSTYHKTELPVNIVAQKVWDGNNPKRPESVKVSLKANDEIVGDEVTLNADNNWQYKWSDLPYKDDEGRPIVYSVTEESISEYITVIEEEIDQETGDLVFKVINKFESTNRTVKKVWDDDNNSRNKRPESIEVQLLQDGIPHREPVELNESNEWSYTWENLALIIDENHLHEYEIKEVPVEGYETSISDKSDPETGELYTEITNKYKTTSRYVKKQWDDRGNLLELRPESVVVQLLANGEPVGERITLDKDNDWYYEWTNLEIMDGELPIEYTVVEEFVNHYRNEIVPVMSDEDEIINPDEGETPEDPIDPEEPVEPEEPAEPIEPTNPEEQKVEGFIVTNILDFTQRTALKIWDDEDNKSGKRPESITVQLMQDGIPYGEPVELSEENDWYYTWDYLSATNGQVLYDYSIEELPVKGYKTEIETIHVEPTEGEEGLNDESTERAYIITNSLIKPDPVEPEDKISITGRKVWIGGPDIKPTIELQLFRNDQPYGSTVELRNGVSAYTWDDLDAKDSQGRKYVYTVKELDVPNNYDSQVLNNGTTVVNTWIDYSTPPGPGIPSEPGDFPILPWEPIYPRPVEPWKPIDPDAPIVNPIEPEEPSERPEDEIVKPEEPIGKPKDSEEDTVDLTKPDKKGDIQISKIPKTGDDNLLLIYGGVLMLSLIGLGITIIRRIKERQ